MTASFRVFNQSFTCKNPLVIPFDVSFATSLNVDLDLQADIDQGNIDFINSIYIDLRRRNIGIDVVTNLVMQRVSSAPNSIQYAPLMIGTNPVIRLTATALDPLPVKVIVSNIPFYPFYQQFT